jgi:hypothetical protein
MTQLRTSNRAAVARYRSKNRRLDYVPSAAALAVIEHHRAAKLDTCIAGVVDALVLAGHSVVSGHLSQDGRDAQIGAQSVLQTCKEQGEIRSTTA